MVDAAGWGVILLETVGTGQSETEIAEIADISLVVNAPGLGDDIQAIKSGILEIADVLVINKADLPLATRAEQHMKSMLALRAADHQQVPVVKTIATDNEGIDVLLNAIDERRSAKLKARGQKQRVNRARRLLAQQLAHQVKALVLAGDADMAVVQEWLNRLRSELTLGEQMPPTDDNPHIKADCRLP